MLLTLFLRARTFRPGCRLQVVLVTGATGHRSDDGREFAAAGRGWSSLAGPWAGEPLVGDLRAGDSQTKFIAGDVVREETVQAWVAAALREFGRLDVAINNAGVEGALGPLVEQSAENFAHVFDINVKGVLFSMKHEIPAIARQGGAIVNVSSIVGDIAMPGGLDLRRKQARGERHDPGCSAGNGRHCRSHPRGHAGRRCHADPSFTAATREHSQAWPRSSVGRLAQPQLRRAFCSWRATPRSS